MVNKNKAKSKDLVKAKPMKLKMLDVKSFLSALKICWLKRIQCNDGKITKILQNLMCTFICSIRKRNGEFGNMIMQRVKKLFLGGGGWGCKHYKKLCGKCTPLSFDYFASE